MTFNQKYTKKKPKVKGGPPLMPGDTVFEVFINHVKKATVTAISRCRSPDNKAKEKYNYIISISCEDGTLSPRYYATDLGKFIFLAEEEAAAKAKEYRNISVEIVWRRLAATVESGRKIEWQ